MGLPNTNSGRDARIKDLAIEEPHVSIHANAMQPCPISLYDILLPDVYLGIGHVNPERPFCKVIDADDGTHPVRTILWSGLLADATRAASCLLLSGQAYRAPGNPIAVHVCILADSSYTYYVYEVAVFLLGWTVCGTHDPCRTSLKCYSAGPTFHKE